MVLNRLISKMCLTTHDSTQPGTHKRLLFAVSACTVCFYFKFNTWLVYTLEVLHKN